MVQGALVQLESVVKQCRHLSTRQACAAAGSAPASVRHIVTDTLRSISRPMIPGVYDVVARYCGEDGQHRGAQHRGDTARAASAGPGRGLRIRLFTPQLSAAPRLPLNAVSASRTLRLFEPVSSTIGGCSSSHHRR
jgi:hypothetical protein